MESTQSIAINNGSLYGDENMKERNMEPYLMQMKIEGKDPESNRQLNIEEKKELSQNEKEALRERIKGMSIEEIEYLVRLIDPEILIHALSNYVYTMKELQNSISLTYGMMQNIPSNIVEQYQFNQAMCNWNIANGSNEKTKSNFSGNEAIMKFLKNNTANGSNEKAHDRLIK